jgi:hypothetical protein
MNYKKKRLTDAQYQINCRQKYDSRVTDNFLKGCGLNATTFSKLPTELLQARLAVLELKNFYWHLLTKQQAKTINKFNSKVINKKKCHLLNPSLAYPILNLATKIKRQAHQQELQAKQKIKELRYNQP